MRVSWLAGVLAVALVAVWLVRVRRAGMAVRLHPAGVLSAAVNGVPLIVRTLALRAILLLTTWVAAGLGEVTLAAHQVAFTVWTLLAFALDALAIAGQALTGKGLGAADVAGVRDVAELDPADGLVGGVVQVRVTGRHLQRGGRRGGRVL